MSLYILTALLFFTSNLKDTISFEFFDNSYKVNFYLYTRHTSQPDILEYGNDTALARSSFNIKSETIIYIHGWLESPSFEGPQAILNAYLELMDCNIILVDWSSSSQKLYFSNSAPSVPVVGEHVAEMIKWMEKRNRFNISDLQFIGFSLGAHVAGFMAKNLAPQKVRRITGLDPASPHFEGASASDRLDKSDAVFVDIIHTNSKLFGMISPIGHVDFYPNGGKTQTDCWAIDITCSHRYAYKYYAQSIKYPKRFKASQCDFINKTLSNCQSSTSTVMGHFTNKRMHGVFYVDINNLTESEIYQK